MTTFLAAGAALFTRAIAFIGLAAIIIIFLAIAAQAAFGAPVVSAEPLPQPPSGGVSMAWLRDLAVFIFCIIAIGYFVWRVSIVDGLAHGFMLLVNDEMKKRGLMEVELPLAESMVSDADAAWAAEADKVAPPPPPAPAPRPKPHVVHASAKDIAKTFRAKGRA